MSLSQAPVRAPMRSMLFAPGNHARRVEKALGLGADAVILDLEDAVARAEKVAAREPVRAARAASRRGRLYVRVNAMGTEWCLADLDAVVGPNLDGIILPKAEAAWQVLATDWIIGQLEATRGLPSGGIDLLPLIETGAGIEALPAIGRACPRVQQVAFGAGDFCLDLGLRWTRDETELAAYRAMIVSASRAAGLQAPIDTVWTRLDDPEGFRLSAERASNLGFGGKLCIHPDQIDPAHTAFTPNEAEVHQARRIVAAFAEAEAQGLASIQLDGVFIDYPIADRAQRLLARAELANAT